MVRESNQDGQVLKGLLDMLALDVLARGENYGFGLQQALQDRLGDDAAMLKQGTLYPLLHRLESRGYLTSYRVAGERGSPRKYYAITASGREFLAARIDEWRKVARLLAKTLSVEGHEPAQTTAESSKGEKT